MKGAGLGFGRVAAVLISGAFVAVVGYFAITEKVACYVEPGDGNSFLDGQNWTVALLPGRFTVATWDDERCCEWAASFYDKQRPEPCGRAN